MLNRDACERRVYRLAVLLTGNLRAAAGVISQVVDSQPDLRKLDSAHLDRLTILRSREVSPQSIENQAISPSITAALAKLPPQQREAWVLGRVYRLPLRELSRAMDCSMTATTRHLQLSDDAMQTATANQPTQAAQLLLEYSLTLDVPQFYRQQQQRRRFIRRVLWAAAILILLAVIMAIAYWSHAMWSNAA